MIICITCYEQIRGTKTLIVSHGVNYNTGRVVILPCEPPDRLGAEFNSVLHEWVIYDKPSEKDNEGF